jgi:hypothetical protein
MFQVASFTGGTYIGLAVIGTVPVTPPAGAGFLRHAEQSWQIAVAVQPARASRCLEFIEAGTS